MLDDINLGLQSKKIKIGDLPQLGAEDLGPLIELRHAGLIENPAAWLHAGRHAELLTKMALYDKWFHPADRQGFVTIPAIKDVETNFTDFAMRAKRGAMASGFAADEAGQLVAAMREFRSNIVEHSRCEDSGYLVYDASPQRFEFVVADAGIGVLESLRSNPNFAGIIDAGTALELALSEGISRYHDQTGRGRGFRPLFVGLANASRHMRFRSADHSREVSRLNGTPQSSTHQRAKLQGFMCSVLCETGNSP